MERKRFADRLSTAPSPSLSVPHRTTTSATSTTTTNTTTTTTTDEADVCDAVDMLRNICVQRKWPLPTYVSLLQSNNAIFVNMMKSFFAETLNSFAYILLVGLDYCKHMVIHIVLYSLSFVNCRRSNALASHQRRVSPNNWHFVLYWIFYKVFHETRNNSNWYRWRTLLPNLNPNPSLNPNRQNFYHIVSY